MIVELLLPISAQIVVFPILGLQASLSDNLQFARLHWRFDRSQICAAAAVRSDALMPDPAALAAAAMPVQ